MEKRLIKKRGKDLKHWIDVVKKTRLEKYSEILAPLKSNHAFTYGFANFVSLKSQESDAESFSEKEVIQEQY